MKRSRFLVLACIAMALALALGGCGSTTAVETTSSSSSEPQNPFVGIWEIVSQEKVHNEDLEAEKAAGRSRFIILEEDGTARSEYLGTETEGTFKQKGATTATLSIDDPTWSSSMSLEDQLLVVIGSDGLRYRFEQVSQEDYEDYEPASGERG